MKKNLADSEWSYGSEIVVNVLITTYNHERFISRAIESALNQVTDFRVQLIINDDASTDMTSNIVRSYQEKYPDTIVAILHERNQYSLGKKPWYEELFPSVNSQYVAMLDGDDYWTDAYKLSKQVEFLRSNQHCSMVYHDLVRVGENEEIIQKEPLSSDYFELSNVDFLRFEYSTPPTSTLMFKSEILKKIPSWFPLLPYGDRGLTILASNHGMILGLKEKMGVYRVHSGGVKSGSSYLKNTADDIYFRKLMIKNLRFSDQSIYQFNAQRIIELELIRFSVLCLKNKNFKGLIINQLKLLIFFMSNSKKIKLKNLNLLLYFKKIVRDVKVTFLDRLTKP